MKTLLTALAEGLLLRMSPESIFVTRRDILNIKTRVQDQAVIKHQDDATSVMLAVAELQQEEFNPVLYYKQQHVADENYPQFSSDAFLLMFPIRISAADVHALCFEDSVH